MVATKPQQRKTTLQEQPTQEFMKIPIKDSQWVMTQKPSVQRFWLECWQCDPYGSRWMPLNTTLKDKTLKQAKAALRKAGLFDFKSEMRMLEGKRYYETLVINLHGSRTTFWLGGVEKDPDSGGVEEDPSSEGVSEPEIGHGPAPDGVTDYPTSEFQSQSQQGVQNLSVSFQELLKGVLESHQETEQPPQGAAPTRRDSQEERTPPAAMDSPTAFLGGREAPESTAALSNKAEVVGEDAAYLGDVDAAAPTSEQFFQLVSEANVCLKQHLRAAVEAFSPKQLQVAFEDLQRRLKQRGSATMTQRVEMAVSMGRMIAPGYGKVLAPQVVTWAPLRTRC